MSEIPEDIMNTAIEAHEAQITADVDDEPLIIARAILAERERCAKIANDYEKRAFSAAIPAQEAAVAAAKIASAIRGNRCED